MASVALALSFVCAGKCHMQSPHKIDNEGHRTPEAKEKFKSLNAVAWVLSYASTVGDYLPDDNVVVTPRREKKDMHEEYKADMESSSRQSLSYGAFCRLLKDNPDLKHIRVSKLKGNFERCSKCKNLDEQLRAAIKSGQFDKVNQIKEQRRVHVRMSRGERLYYYGKREMAAKGNCTSIIIDKWDQKKVSAPWFVSAVKG